MTHGKLAGKLDCIFCKIVAGESPARIVYRDDLVTAFHDIHPLTPVHILIVPNRHVASVDELEPEDEALVGHLVLVAGALARQEGIAEKGYRLILNTGPQSGQSVFHLHLHLISGRLTRFILG
jgi:histidine triad (HIT) family protein